MEFVQAKYYTPTVKRAIDLMVIHDMEAPEKGDTAENVANYFRNGATKASAHYCIDNNSVVQSVKDMDVAWAAPGANHNGLHFEHAGYARQTAADWSDSYSQQMLSKSAILMAEKCTQYTLPMSYVLAEGIRRGYRGITTHLQITLANGTKGGHTDPGIYFPMPDYIKMVQNAANVPIHQEVRAVLNAPIIAIMAHPSGRGYWQIASDGGVFPQGEAKFHGSLGGVKLNMPVVSGVPTPSGNGYWLTAEDGGVFPFGDAEFFGVAGEYRG